MPQTKLSQYFKPQHPSSDPNPDHEPSTTMDSSQDFNEQKSTGFLDLPGEIRNQIYEMLLPNAPFRDLAYYNVKGTTSFMATNRQIHREAAGILYGDRDFKLRVHSDGSVEFLGHFIELADIETSNLSALNQIKVLSIVISSGQGYEVCDVQDALFKVLAHFHDKHKLHTLNVSIDISGEYDSGYEMFTSNYAERMYLIDVMREFRDIAPGDISRGHLAAFLADPLRILRGLKKDGKKQPKFTLDFAGKSGRPWRDIKPEVFTLIKGDSPVANYKVFSPYYDALRAVSKFMREHDLMRPYVSKLAVLARARIRGDVMEFRQWHESYWLSYCQRTRERLAERVAGSAEELEQKEHQMRKLEYFIANLDAKLLAAGTDTSFFGYNSADDALREWQLRGRKEEKEAKAKRKEEREKRKREAAEDAEAAAQSGRKRIKV